MKQLFCLPAFLIILIFLSAAAAGLEHKPFPMQQEKTTTVAEKNIKETPGFFVWLIILIALSVGIGLVVYALLAYEKKQRNVGGSRNL